MIEPGTVYCGKNRWVSIPEYQRLVANGELETPSSVGRPVEDGVAKLQIVSLGGSLDPNYSPPPPEPRSSYVGAAGAPQVHLELPTLFAGEKKAEQGDGKHLPLPSTARK